MNEVEEFDLSSKIFDVSINEALTEEHLHYEDVKKAIELIIKKFKGMDIVSGAVIQFEINKIVGKELEYKNEVKEIPKGFKEGICKCGNKYLYCGLDMKLCIKCLDALEQEVKE